MIKSSCDAWLWGVTHADQAMKWCIGKMKENLGIVLAVEGFISSGLACDMDARFTRNESTIKCLTWSSSMALLSGLSATLAAHIMKTSSASFLFAPS